MEGRIMLDKFPNVIGENLAVMNSFLRFVDMLPPKGLLCKSGCIFGWGCLYCLSVAFRS